MDMGCHGLAWFRWMLGGQPRAAQRHGPHADRAHPPGPDALRRALGLHRGVRGGRGWRGREQLGHARRHGGPRRGQRHRRRDLRRPVQGQLGVDVQRKRLRLRDGESRHDPGLDLHHVRGSLQSGIPARVETLHRLRPRGHAAGRHGRRRPRGPRVDVRRVPLGPHRAESPVAVRGGQNRQACRSVAGI